MVTNFLKEWIIQIVITFTFVSLLEIVLPNGKMKKYIDMIIGLLIIIVIINPFIKFIFKDINIERNVFSSSEKFANEYEVDKDILKLQQDQIKSVYVMKLEEDMINIVEEKTNFIVSKAHVEIIDELESEDFGVVEKVYLEVDEKDNSLNEEKQVVNIEKVEEVNIDWDSDQTISEDEYENDSEIKAIISEKYDIPEANIYILLNRRTEGE